MRDESRFYGEMLYRKKIFILLDFGIINCDVRVFKYRKYFYLVMLSPIYVFI